MYHLYIKYNNPLLLFCIFLLFLYAILLLLVDDIYIKHIFFPFNSQSSIILIPSQILATFFSNLTSLKISLLISSVKTFSSLFSLKAPIIIVGNAIIEINNICQGLSFFYFLLIFLLVSLPYSLFIFYTPH